ncbi:MAG TPA: CoA transferase [Usitatibacteraceae bacterium]|nr:CoA transferase [Usitatibacteraceae bacterium]
MHTPLNNFRVLDLSNVLAGPFCAYQLALMGAEVIKVEVPGQGDLARSLGAEPAAAAQRMGVSFLAVNAGKQSITLNLKHAEGKAILKQLVARADVLVENFRPGVMARLALDYPVLQAVNPALVYCAISGFGQDGPWAQRPAYDQIIQGLSGLMSVTGDSASAPLRAGFPVCDTLGGMAAAFAIAAALAGRARSGTGCLIDVSMLEATLASMGWVVSNYLATGEAPRPMGNDNFTAAPSGTFATADGLLNIAANEQRQFEALCEAIGRPDLKTDDRFAAREARKHNRAALNGAIESALSRRTAQEWEAILVAAGVPAGRVMSLPQILAEPQVRDRGFVLDLGPVPGLGQNARATRSGFRVDGHVPQPSPPPQLGAHTATWLHELGYDDAEIARLRGHGVI